MEHLITLLHNLVNRTPWTSEEQHRDQVALLRKAEDHLAQDNPDYTSVLPTVPPQPEPPTVVAASGGAAIDYDALAAAIVRQQEAAAEQRAQAAAATAADPGFTTPGAETSASAETHAAAAAS